MYSLNCNDYNIIQVLNYRTGQRIAKQFSKLTIYLTLFPERNGVGRLVDSYMMIIINNVLLPTFMKNAFEVRLLHTLKYRVKT